MDLKVPTETLCAGFQGKSFTSHEMQDAQLCDFSQESFWQIKLPRDISRSMFKEECRFLLVLVSKAVEMSLSQNDDSNNQLVFTLSLTRLCVHACDAQSNSLKIITPISETVWFLKIVRNLYDAFSKHKKGQSAPPRTLPDAVEKVPNSVRPVEWCSKIKLNASHGMVSAATVSIVLSIL